MSGNDGNKKYRDSVFCSYFNNNERLLSLCNAILGTDYKDAAKLEINTLEGIFFDEQRNDISCTIEDHFLVLIEYQTTINENMPFRCLSYVVEILNKLVTDKNKLYRHPLITFPSPKFVVLYDGDAKEPLEREMRLSDAFWGKNHSLELIVKSYNINYNFEQKLLQKCDYLNDYSILVFKVKEGLAAGLTRRKAISKAVKDCIAKGIMKGYLEFHSEEVFNMLELQWDRTAALQARYEDGFDEGRNEGHIEGRIEGIGIGRTQLKQLINFLMKNGKQEEIQIALNDDSKCNELLKKYGII